METDGEQKNYHDIKSGMMGKNKYLFMRSDKVFKMLDKE